MEFLTRNASIRDRVGIWHAAGGRVALVPTAGSLHKGHMSLVARAQEQADHVIVSIFANPQDGQVTTLEADRELLQKIGTSVVFVPPQQEIYPMGRELGVSINVPTLTSILEGKFRPGHYADKCVVLTKLFDLIQPNVVLFGERDFQQLVIMRRLVDDLFLATEVIGCATWRDADGLAIAKANRLMTIDERALAPRLYATLKQSAAEIDGGVRDYARVERQGMQMLLQYGFEPEYFAIRQANDLGQSLPASRDLVILSAVRLNAHRLIDNLRVRVIDRY